MSQIRCQQPKCRNDYTGTENDARALDWMIWSGTTLGGKVSEIRYCPTHAGRTEEAAEAQETGFDAECYTCSARASDEEGDRFLGTEEDAEGWAEEHQCEPETRIIRPKVKAGATA